MNTLFLLIGLALLLAGPIAGYRFAMRQATPSGWQVAVWSAAGGALAANVFIGVLLLIPMIGHAPRSGLLPAAASSIGWWALFALVLGLAGLVRRPAGTLRLVVTGLAMVAIVAVVRIGFDRAKPRQPDPGISGVVIGTGGAPVAGAPVFLDRGSGPLERLTTDARGVFHAPPGATDTTQALLLICAPSGLPYVARIHEHLLTPPRYYIPPFPPGAVVEPSGIRALGWRQAIPRECMS